MADETINTEAKRARKAAKAIETDCLDRRAIKWGFNGIDDDIREDILCTWTQIILKAMQK